MNFLISRAHSMEFVNTTQKLPFLVVNLEKENVANIWQNEWKWKRLMKFDRVRIHFDTFGFVIQNFFVTMAKGPNDFSLLLSKITSVNV